MKTNKITSDNILAAIEERAAVIVRKKQLYEEVKKINAELKMLSEMGPIMSGSFGFKQPSDTLAKTSVSGFETTPNISFIAQLEKEMGVSNEAAESSELERIKRENEILKQKLADKSGK